MVLIFFGNSLRENFRQQIKAGIRADTGYHANHNSSTV
jgi:hypothetical protein